MDEVLGSVSYDMLTLYVDLNLRLRKKAALDGSAKFHFWIKPAGLGKFPSNGKKTRRRRANVRGQSHSLSAGRTHAWWTRRAGRLPFSLAGQWSELYTTREQAIDAVVRCCGAGPETPRHRLRKHARAHPA